MLSLLHPYISVRLDGQYSYGGGQQFSDRDMVRRCGCGIVAALDTLLYLYRFHDSELIPLFSGLREDRPVPRERYNELVDHLRRHYLPMIPYAGINGLMLAVGMQRFFRRYALPYSCRWCFSGKELWGRIDSMLANDIPVIMSVGPNLPFFWHNETTRFYARHPSGELQPSSGAHSHYFTVTGMDEDWLRISSWGRKYYVNRNEFEHYARRKSIPLVCNILYIERKP